MNSPTKTSPVLPDLSGIEIMHNVLLWCYNWTEEDFEIAFKDSHLGWDYHWNKLQGKIRNRETAPTTAVVEVILNMDKKHQEMLFDYIFTKQEKEILSARKWQKLIAEAEASNSREIVIELPEDEIPEDPDQLSMFDD